MIPLRGAAGRGAPRRRSVRLSACVTAAALWPAAAGAAAADPILPLSDVRPGMVGEARTVVRGTEISTFPVTIIDVLRIADGPGGTLVLVRAEGPLMDETGGVADGMSGSPVYVTGADGTARVVGAIAYGSGDERNVVVGVTPIEQMIDSSSGLRANEVAPAPPRPPARRPAMVRDRTAARAVETATPDRVALYPLTRWSVAGVSRPLMRRLAGRLARGGIRVTSIAPRTPRPPVPLVPGASLAAVLAGGDVSVGAVGTVTYVDGGTVLGFGHPLLGAGPSRFLMADGFVVQTVAAPITGGSHKLVEPGTLQGMIVNDRSDGITGRIGPVEAISGISTATNEARGVGSTVRVTLAPDERTAPDLSSLLQSEPASRVIDGAVPGTLTLRISITSPDLPAPFVYRNVYASAEDLSRAGAGQLPGLVFAFMRNGLRRVPISAIRVSQRFEPRVRAARILAVGVRDAVRPGGRATLILRVQPWRASVRVVKVPIRLPEGVDRESPELRVVPKSPNGFSEPYGGWFFEGGDSVTTIGPGQTRLARQARALARESGGTRLEQVMTGLAEATDDRHDAVRVLSGRDNPEEQDAGITVPVPDVIYDGVATTRVTFRPAR